MAASARETVMSPPLSTLGGTNPSGGISCLALTLLVSLAGENLLRLGIAPSSTRVPSLLGLHRQQVLAVEYHTAKKGMNIS